jgi:ribulose-phosphate 3-epimerase
MKKNNIQISPSIFAGDFGKLAEEARRIEEAGADAVHVDIMDGHFVPNLTLGPKALAAINRATPLFLDVHIMIYNPFDFVERLVESGADRITFHFEATEEIEMVLEYIRKCGIQAGLALRPETSEEFAFKYLTSCDLLLLMTVSPGFGGQAFMPEVLEKIRHTREFCTKLSIGAGGQVMKKGHKPHHPFLIQVDGGIEDETLPQCLEAGANVFVAGTALFKAENMAEKIAEWRAMAS